MSNIDFRRLHRAIDEELRRVLKQRFPDATEVARLKRAKLRAKDRITATA